MEGLSQLEDRAQNSNSSGKQSAKTNSEPQTQIVELRIHVRERGLQVSFGDKLSHDELPGSLRVRFGLFLYHATFAQITG